MIVYLGLYEEKKKDVDEGKSKKKQLMCFYLHRARLCTFNFVRMCMNWKKQKEMAFPPNTHT